MAERVEHLATARHAQHDRGERDLQHHAGRDEFPVDGALVVGEQPRDREQHGQSEQAEADSRQVFHRGPRALRQVAQPSPAGLPGQPQGP